MLNDPLELFWLCAHTENSVLPYEQFRMIPEDVRSSLLDAGLLKEGQPSRTVECDGCDEGHVEEVMQIDYADSKRRFFISCPECTSVDVNPKRLKQWVPDYGKVAKLLHQSLSCNGTIQTVLAGRLWNVGRSALAGQSRPVWLVRVLNDETAQHIPKGKQPVLFIVAPLQQEVTSFDPERTFEMNRVAYIDNGQLLLDTEAVHSQLNAVVQSAEPIASPNRKDTKRASAIKAAKRELHQHILSMKSLLANSDDKLPRLTQKELAKRLDESEPMISRVLKEPDELLGILWQTANDENMIRQYSRQHG